MLVGFGLFAACSQGEQHPPMLGDCDGCGNPIIPGVTDAKADVMPDTKADVMNDAGTTADATDATADAADAAAEAGIHYGWVIDFIDVHIVQNGIERHWPTFNVADIAICVGVGLMAVDMMFGKRGVKPQLMPDAPSDRVPEPPAEPAKS